MMPPVLAFVLATLYAVSYAQTPNVPKVLFPAGGEQFYRTDVLNVTFTTLRQSVTVIGYHVTERALLKFHEEPVTVTSEDRNLKWVLISFENAVGMAWIHLMEDGINSNAFLILDSSRAATTVGLTSPKEQMTPTPTPTPTSTPSGSSPVPTLPSAGSPGVEPPTGREGAPSLGPGAIVGISIASAIVAIGLGVFAGIFWSNRRQRRLEAPIEADDGKQQMAQYDATAPSAASSSPCQNCQVHSWEMPSKKAPSELPDARYLAELPGARNS